MKTSLYHLLAGLVWMTGTVALSAAELGEPAAPLRIAEWVKGEAVDLAAVKGKKTVVVEFWATWCGPCRASIPHLTELQKKFRDRGVVFVGVSDEAPGKVKPFVDEMGEKMDYTVAIDENRKTSAGYMEAYGINGIPHAFVVDTEGRVVWQGHPMAGLDKALERIASKTFDLATEKKRDAAQRKLQEYYELAGQENSGERLNKLGQELSALDKELGGIEPGEKLDLEGMRKSAQFQSVMRDYQRALAGGKSEAELAKLEAKAKPLAPAGFNFAQFKGSFQLQGLFRDYYREVSGNPDSEKAGELEKKLGAIQSGQPELLNQIAWTLLTDEKIKKRDLKLALHFAKAACDGCDGKDPNILDTYARALFDNGKVDEAIQQQKRAVDLVKDTDAKADFEETLKHYQAKAAK